jgi:hypothetical protein
MTFVLTLYSGGALAKESLNRQIQLVEDIPLSTLSVASALSPKYPAKDSFLIYGKSHAGNILRACHITIEPVFLIGGNAG